MLRHLHLPFSSHTKHLNHRRPKSAIITPRLHQATLPMLRDLFRSNRPIRTLPQHSMLHRKGLFKLKPRGELHRLTTERLHLTPVVNLRAMRVWALHIRNILRANSSLEHILNAKVTHPASSKNRPTTPPRRNNTRNIPLRQTSRAQPLPANQRPDKEAWVPASVNSGPMPHRERK